MRQRHHQRGQPFLLSVEFSGRKALKVGALAAIDPDHLTVVARLKDIGLRRCRRHPQVKGRIGQWVGQIELPDKAQGFAVSCASGCRALQPPERPRG